MSQEIIYQSCNSDYTICYGLSFKLSKNLLYTQKLKHINIVCITVLDIQEKFIIICMPSDISMYEDKIPLYYQHNDISHYKMLIFFQLSGS